MLSCVDAKTGAPHYTAQRIPGVDKTYASPVAAGGYVYLTSVSGTTVVIKDATTDKRVEYRSKKRAEGIVSILSAPIKTREKVIGCLRLYTGAPREFSEEEIMMVSALAHTGGLAIQNATLYLQLQDDIKDLQDDIWSHRSWF